ncbi:hypothetical protein HAX54_011730 [Datura stramonium]|uniref:Uncharacterized protein n=1 Tax=Datura stramonium TaxID=4076 RepID=A0ABS8RZ29_DATST|nr:hypothetical protein [Datura stramonium]
MNRIPPPRGVEECILGWCCQEDCNICIWVVPLEFSFLIFEHIEGEICLRPKGFQVHLIDVCGHGDWYEIIAKRIPIPSHRCLWSWGLVGDNCHGDRSRSSEFSGRVERLR